MAWTAAAVTVRAAEPLQRVRLGWVRGEGTESCLDRDALEQRVRERLGRDPFSQEAPVSIDGIVARDGSGWHAQLRIRSNTDEALGTRQLDSGASDCSAISEAVVLAVALTIDPSAGSAASAAAFPPEPTAPSPPQALLQTGPLPEPPRALPSVEPGRNALAPGETAHGTRALEVVARAGAALGVLPGLASDFGIASTYGSESFQLSLGLSLFPERQTDDGRFAFGLTTGSAGACYRAGLGASVHASLCAELQVGALHAVVLDTAELVPLGQGDHWWLAGAVGPRLSWIPAPPLRLEMGALLIAPISRERFAIRGSPDTLFQSAAVAGAAYVGVGAGFP
jgi:hypothetical protein